MRATGKGGFGVAAFEYIDNLCDQLEAELERAANDLFAACLEGGSHGTLLALRYTVTGVMRGNFFVSPSFSTFFPSYYRGAR
jgi:hypothetical protein